MRFCIVFLTFFIQTFSFAQQTTATKMEKDSLIIIAANPDKGFVNDYLLYIPKETPVGKKLTLLVEPNNTGQLNDSIEVHKDHAIFLASKSSVGNNVSRMLKIPLLVPVFPRPASQPLTYTHALDRDVMLETKPELKRLDLQLLNMIKDAGTVLASFNIEVEPKVFMSGFSASATFINRFAFIHPEQIKALAIGGFNGELMLPVKQLNGENLNYPLGTNDFLTLFKHEADTASFRSIPQFIYMGQLDDNDAVQYDDAYSETERSIINSHKGKDVQSRFIYCQKVYQEHQFNVRFKTYEAVGHWTTSAMNIEVIKFFLKQMR